MVTLPRSIRSVPLSLTSHHAILLRMHGRVGDAPVIHPAHRILLRELNRAVATREISGVLRDGIVP